MRKSGIGDMPVKSIGIPDEFVEHGSLEILRAKYSLDARGIAREVLALIHNLESFSLPLSSHEGVSH
jgi:deoxyxylulose-5-phosphate synthase